MVAITEHSSSQVVRRLVVRFRFVLHCRSIHLIPSTSRTFIVGGGVDSRLLSENVEISATWYVSPDDVGGDAASPTCLDDILDSREVRSTVGRLKSRAPPGTTSCFSIRHIMV